MTPTTTTSPPAFRKPTTADLQNRYLYHPPKGDQPLRYNAIRESILQTAVTIVDNTPCCPEQTRALNALDEAMMIANAAIARHEHHPAAVDPVQAPQPDASRSAAPPAI